MCVCVCVCVCVRGVWEGVTAWTCSQEKGNDQHFGVWIAARGELSHLPPLLPPVDRLVLITERGGAL